MSKRNVFLRLWDYLRQYKGALFLAVFLKIFSSVMSVLEPFVLGLAITELTSNLLDMAHGVAGAHINISYIAIILVLYFVRGMGYELSSYGANFFITKAVQKTIHDLRHDLSEKINKIPVSYFDSQQFGNVLGRFTSDVETISNALQQSFLRSIEAFTTITLVICMVLYLNWHLALVVIAIIPITYFSAKFILGKSQPYFKEQADALGDMNGFVQENLSGFNVIKLYGREDISSQEFREITQNLQEVGFKASFISGIMMPVLSAISDMAYLIIAVLGALQVLSGQLTVGNMQAFVQYVWQVSQPVQTITQLASVLQSAKSSLDRIFEVLDEPEEAAQVTEKLEHDLSGQVTFENVSVLDVYEKTLAVFKDYYQYEVIQGADRKMMEKIPQAAFREAIANALIHRVWDINSHIRVSMFDDKIEVVSPGGLPAGITAEEYLSGKLSILRNRNLANVFYRLGLVEIFGTGITRIKHCLLYTSDAADEL